MNEKDLTHLMATLGYDKDTLPDYFKQRGEDLGTTPVEITVSEGMQAGPTEVTGSGIKIDKNSAATVAGLFACGDACDHNRCVHGAVAGGYKAGKSAAAFARTFRHGYQAPGVVTREQIDRFMEPLHRSSGYAYRQIEDTIRKIILLPFTQKFVHNLLSFVNRLIQVVVHNSYIKVFLLLHFFNCFCHSFV